MNFIYILFLGLISSNLMAQEADFNYPMVELEGGSFEMGCKEERDLFCEDDEKLHKVQVKSFKIGTHCVSQKQFKAIMGYNPSHFINCPDAPVDRVSWAEAQEFIEKLNAKTGKKYRLPTEAEWEYAARGGQKSKNFPYASKGIHYSRINSFDGCVSSDQVNEIGLYGMNGHFWEWTSSIYRAYPFDQHIEARDGDLISVRGGSWLALSQGKLEQRPDLQDKPLSFDKAPKASTNNKEYDYDTHDLAFVNGYYPKETRIANRHYVPSDPKDIFGTFSFRLVLDLEE
jgi:formylglycine-generating enzyme required for sulfatase activity